MIAFVLTVLKWALVAFISYRTVRRLWSAHARARAEGRAMPAPLIAALRRLVWSVSAVLLSGGAVILTTGIRGSLVTIFLLSCAWMAVAIAQVGIRAYKDELGELEERH